MEEVLQRIYKIKQRNIQRKRIEKALETEHYLLTQRRKYDFREDSNLLTPRTSLPIDDEIRFEKQLNETTARDILVSYAVPNHQNHLHLPLICKKEPIKPMRRKFRGAVWAVVFLLRLEERQREKMAKRRRRAEKCYKNLLNCVQRLLRGYFQRELREQLGTFVGILEDTVTQQYQQLDQHIIAMLHSMAEKLSVSTITKDMLQFLVQAATNHAFPPTDFLAAMEISRLRFSPKYGCLVDVSQEQTRMMVALGLGIKIFCFYLLAQPWKLGMATEPVVEHASAIRETINNIVSVFHYMLIEDHCLQLKEVNSLSKHQLASFGIRQIAQLDPFGDSVKEPSTSKQLIKGLSRAYCSSLQLKYPEKCKEIRVSLGKWVSRITYACLKEASRKERGQEQSIYYRTLVKKCEAIQERPQKRPYRSLQIERGRPPSVERLQRALPSIKRTIQ